MVEYTIYDLGTITWDIIELPLGLIFSWIILIVFLKIIIEIKKIIERRKHESNWKRRKSN